MYLSNSTKMTTNTETAMLSSMVEAVELPICDGGCQVKCRQGIIHCIHCILNIQGQSNTFKRQVKCKQAGQVQSNVLYRDKYNQICYTLQGQVESEGKWTSLKRKYQAYVIFWATITKMQIM